MLQSLSRTRKNRLLESINAAGSVGMRSDRKPLTASGASLSVDIALADFNGVAPDVPDAVC